MTSGTATKGTNAKGPAISEITQIKKKTNGRSTIAISVAEVKNSRSVSNSLTILARAPVFWFRSSSLIISSLSKIKRAIFPSARFPALSTKLARNIFIMKSKTNAITTPIVRAINDSMASFGTTRS